MNAHRRERAGLFVAPLSMGLLVLTLIPLLATAALSLTRWNGLDAQALSYAGIENYRSILGCAAPGPTDQADATPHPASTAEPQDPLFAQALKNSLTYTAMVVPLELLTALAVAILLNRGGRGMVMLRTLVYLPWLLGGVASLVVWSWLLNPQFGWINVVLRAIYEMADPVVKSIGSSGTSKWPAPDWLYSPASCKPALVLIHLWSIGGTTLVYLAALRHIPLELTECARLDGAGRWTRLRWITAPLLRPAIAFNALIAVIFAMQSFTESLVLQNRSQRDGLVFVSHYLYRTAFESPYRMGRAAAAGCVLIVVVAVLIAPLLALSRRTAWMHAQHE